MDTLAIERIKTSIKNIVPKTLLLLYWRWFPRKPKDLIWRAAIFLTDVPSLIALLSKRGLKASFYQRLLMIKQLYKISYAIPCPHTQHEILSFIGTILSMPQHIEGCVVEAGSYKGGSTAKFSIAARIVDRQLVVFDSFEGIPENNELAPNGKPYHPAGIWCGTLDEVETNIREFGAIEVCQLIKGWFDDTMPKFNRPIVAVYLDVDLASSTRTCLRYLYRLLAPGGVLYSQDGHLPLVIDVFNDDRFWEEEVGCPKPHIEGLGKQKLIKIVKPE